MPLKFQKIYQQFSFFGFLILFPGFFVYHFCIAKGYIPPVLGGYFGVMATLLVFPLFILNFKVVINPRVFVVKIFFLICFLIFFVSVINFVLSKPNFYAKDMFVWSVSGVLFNLVAFLVAKSAFSKKGVKLLFLFLVSMFFIVVANIGSSGIFYLKGEAGDVSGIVSTYQGFARSIVVVLLVLTAFYFQRSYLFFVIFFVGIVMLFLNGSRTEFAVYCATVLFVYALYSLNSIKRQIGFLILILVFLLGVIYGMSYFPESRMFQLLNIMDSSSAQARFELMGFGLELISESPLLGDYGAYTVLGGIGYYPHNLLSAWVNLGIFGFILYLMALFLMWRDAFLGFVKGHKNEFKYQIFIMFLAFVTISFFVSKDYSYMLFGLLVGFHYQYKISLKVRYA